VEALLRWSHPARGLLAPADFLVDDDSTLLVRIGWSVVIEAARRAGEWRRAHPERPVTVSVNLAAAQLSSRELSARVEHLLYDNEVPGPNALAFELSEQHVFARRNRVRDRLLPLRNLGVEIVIDDFGATAIAAGVDGAALRDSAVELLESLGTFPLDLVKLDRAFVRRLGPSTAEVVDAAHAAGMRVVALAIEHEEDLRAASDAVDDLLASR
jgi:EAL domain-containing protein (putative c-di-GMP-specific phosphodiesterase class I)